MRNSILKRRQESRLSREVHRSLCEGSLSPLSGGTTSGGGQTGDVITQIPILELAATNLLLQSAAFDNASWTKTNVNVGANTTFAPNGATEADTLTDSSAVATGTVTQNVAIANDGLTRTLSAYFTVGTSSRLQLSLTLNGGATPVVASVDIAPASGQILAQNTTLAPVIQSLTINGVNWFRISVSAANNNSGNNNALCSIIPDNSGVAGVGSVIAWGAQLETGAAASSQIPTTTAQVTRAAGKLAPWILAVLAAGYSMQVFTGNGTYTPSAGTVAALVFVQAAGGGSGSSIGTPTASAGGGGGGASLRLVTAAQIGASQTITVGTGAAAANGGSSSFGALVTATGGLTSAAAVVGKAIGGAGGVGASGDVNINGSGGGISDGSGGGSLNPQPGQGGASLFGGSVAALPADGAATAGTTGVNYGGGASGCKTSAGAIAGGAGAPGIIYVIEFKAT